MSVAPGPGTLTVLVGPAKAPGTIKTFLAKATPTGAGAPVDTVIAKVKVQ